MSILTKQLAKRQLIEKPSEALHFLAELILTQDELTESEKELLETRHGIIGRFLCNDMGELRMLNVVSQNCQTRVVQHIASLLHSTRHDITTLSGWCEEHLSIKDYLVYEQERNNGTQKFREYKAAWCLDMAEYFASKGE